MEECGIPLIGTPSRNYRRAVEDRLDCIAQCASTVCCVGEYRCKEDMILHLFQPLGQAIVTDFKGSSARKNTESVKLSYFNLFILESWRQKIASHSGFNPSLNEFLKEFNSGLSGYDPSRGDFVDWVVYRFPLRLKDYIGLEEHNVRRSQKTESRRRELSKAAEENVDVWGYHRLSAVDEDNSFLLDPASQKEWRQIEAKIELTQVFDRLPEKDRVFLQPCLERDLQNGQELAEYWRISPAAVSKRLHRIRRQFPFLTQ